MYHYTPPFSLSPKSLAVARKGLGWPKRCQLALAFLWEYSQKRLKLAQLLGHLGVFLTGAVGVPRAAAGVARADGPGEHRGDGTCGRDRVSPKKSSPKTAFNRRTLYRKSQKIPMIV